MLETYVPYQLTVAANAVSNLVGSTYRGRFGLSLWQWRILCTLGAEGCMTAQAIVLHSEMDKMTVSRAIQALNRRGLLRRRKSTIDARAFDLELTSSGLAMYREIAPLALALQEAVLSGLSHIERANLLRVLQLVRARSKSLTPAS